MLVLFDGAATNTPVAVNAARVTKVVSDKSGPGLSVIFFASNDYVLVRGTLDAVVVALDRRPRRRGSVVGDDGLEPPTFSV